jgi:hypothetical protein
MAISTVLSLQHRVDGEGVYPFTDYSTFTSVSSTKIPPTVFIDANVYTIGGGVRQYISRIRLTATKLVVDVSDVSGVLCTGELDVSTGSNKIVLKDTLGRIVGLLLGNAEASRFIGAIPEGEHLFDENGMEFVASCVSPQPQQVIEGILTEEEDLLAGDVWLVGKDGVILDWDADKLAIVIHLVGDPLFRKRNCDDGNGTFANSIPLQALTFVTDLHTSVKIKPDEFGNVRFMTGSNQNSANVLRVEKLTNGIRLKAIGNIT